MVTQPMVTQTPVGQTGRQPRSDAAAITLEQWADLPPDEPGELVDGRLVEEEMADLRHELVVSWLIGTLRAWLVPLGGIVVGSDSKFAVRADRGRKPDVVVWLPERPRPSLDASLHREPPDIFVEVVSPRPSDVRRDRVDKLGEYARFGVRWYWLLDPRAHTLEILELGDDGRYSHAASAGDGRLSQVPGCPGLALDLDSLRQEIAAVDATP